MLCVVAEAVVGVSTGPETILEGVNGARVAQGVGSAGELETTDKTEVVDTREVVGRDVGEVVTTKDTVDVTTVERELVKPSKVVVVALVEIAACVIA